MPNGRVATNSLDFSLFGTSGYKEGSFELYWRRQDSKDEKDDFEEKEKEEILEWKSSATLHEINMPTEPIKVKAFVRQKEDGSLPVRVSTVVSSFCAHHCGFFVVVVDV